MADLSPAAQAVLSAAHITYWCHDDVHIADPAFIAAAVLQATADQVVPHEPQECKEFTNEAVRLNRMAARSQFLAIATELGGLGEQLAD